MLQNRSLLPKVEVLSHRGDKTSICCVKLLQSILNFYHHKITKKCRGGYPPPLKRLPVNFCQPRDAPLPHLAEKVKGGGAKLSKGGGRNDLFRYVAKISHPIFERLVLWLKRCRTISIDLFFFKECVFASIPVPEDTNIVCDICACYCSLGHCIDCLVGSGDLLWGGVDCIGHSVGQKWMIWVKIFLQILQIIYLQISLLSSCIWCISPSNTCILRIYG